jgi:hypothetical protein
MKIRRVPRLLAALSLALLLAAPALADTIRLKDGQVIRGQIVSFRDQQFTVLIGAGAAGRRSRVQVYIDDIDSIEFDSGGVSAEAPAPTGDPYTPDPASARASQAPPRTTTGTTNTQRPPTLGNDGEHERRPHEHGLDDARAADLARVGRHAVGLLPRARTRDRRQQGERLD